MRRELGVASIELVIILPLLLALLLLMVDVLRVHLQYSTLEHGLRSVLRELQAESAAGRIPSADGIRLRLQQRGRGELDGVTVSVLRVPRPGARVDPGAVDDFWVRYLEAQGAAFVDVASLGDL